LPLFFCAVKEEKARSSGKARGLEEKEKSGKKEENRAESRGNRH